MEDRRENDKIILDRLEKIQDSQTQFQVNLALNTKATADIEDHLRTLNGKVIINQNSISALQAQSVVTAAFIAKQDTEKEKQETRQEQKTKDKNANWNKLFWIIIGIAFALAGRIIAFAEQSDFFKQIIK